MERRKRIVPIVVVLVLVLGGAYLYSTGNLPFVSADAAGTTTASGFIEGEEVVIAGEVGGRVLTLAVNEGDAVKAGQEIVRLDPTSLDAQIAQAQAAVNTAQAQLTQIKNGPRNSDVAAARAALTAAQQSHDKLRAGATAADLAAARAAVDAAVKTYDKVRAGPTADQLQQLMAQADNAKAAIEQAQAAYDRIGGASNPMIATTPQSTALQQASNNFKAAVAAYNDATSHPTTNEIAAAQAAVDQAQAALARLTPDDAQLAAARSQVEQAQAALERLTPTADSIAVAESQVQQAQAALNVLKIQAGKMTLTSPVNGIVTRRSVHIGEIASPNGKLMTIVDLDPVQLTIYVPETQIGTIQIGAPISVQVDSFPNRTFQGNVTYIASEAEFTPRNVQTKAERVNTVFAVKIEIPNAKMELKSGMPADALLK